MNRDLRQQARSLILIYGLLGKEKERRRVNDENKMKAMRAMTMNKDIYRLGNKVKENRSREHSQSVAYLEAAGDGRLLTYQTLVLESCPSTSAALAALPPRRFSTRSALCLVSSVGKVLTCMMVSR